MVSQALNRTTASNYDSHMQTVIDKKSEMGDLFKRMDNDKKLAILDPYQMKDLDGQITADVVNVTMNEAKVFADRSFAIMTGANMQRVVFGRNLSDRETTTIEEFYDDIYYANDMLLANVLFINLYGALIEQILHRGSIAARILIREEDGNFYPEIFPLDTRFFHYETDTIGMVWGAPEVTRNRAQIERDYGIRIREKSAVVTDWWDDTVNDVYIARQLYKGGGQAGVIDSKKHPERERNHGLGYPPFIFQKSGAGLQTFMDAGILKYQGESIFAPNRGLYPELNRAASIFQTLTSMSFEASLQYESEAGEGAKKPDNPFGRRKVIPVEKGGGFKGIPTTDVKNATRLFYNMLVGALQRGGLPNIDYGNLTFPLSAVAISKLTASKDAIFIPRLNALSLFYRAASQMIKKQYIQGGYSVEIGAEGVEREYSTGDIDKRFGTKYEFYSTSPEQNIANYAIAAQAKAIEISTHTIYRDIIKFNDPEGEINKTRSEKAERGDIAITLKKQLYSLADKDGNFTEKDGRDIDAEMILQQLEMVLQDRANGGTMGLEPQDGGIGAGGNLKPLVDLFDQGGGGGQPAGEEEDMSPEESEKRGERREETVRKSKAEA